MNWLIIIPSIFSILIGLIVFANILMKIDEWVLPPLSLEWKIYLVTILIPMIATWFIMYFACSTFI